MAKKNPPKSVTSNGSTTAIAYLPKLFAGQTIAIQYSTDVANSDFLQVQGIRVTNASGSFTSHKPGSNSYEAFASDPEFQDALITSIGKVKADILSQGTNAYLDAVEAAGRSGNTNTFLGTPTNSNPNIIQPPVTGIGTTVTPPTVNTPAPTEKVADVPIGVPEKDKIDFIKSIVGDKNIISLQYPSDALYGSGPDYLAIEQFTYRAPQGDSLEKPDFIGTLTKGLQRNSNLSDYIGVVRLPIPNNLSMSNSVDWGDSRVNPVEAGAFFSAFKAANTGLSGNIGTLLTDSFKGFGDFFKAVGNNEFSPGTAPGTVVSAFLAQYGLGKIGINVDPAQFIARGTGNTINPNLELLFSGPKLRNFAFQFKFAPNEDTEASICRKIMRFFKQGMAARRTAGQTLFLGSPNVFRLRYLTGDRKTGTDQPIRALPRYKICALTSTEVDYSPGGLYQSYEDKDAGSQPAIMNLTLNFTELTPIFEQDYRNNDKPSQQDLFTTAGGELGAINRINSEDVGF